MPFPIGSLAPLGYAVVATVADWITTGAVLPVLGLYLCLSTGDVLLQKLLRRLVHGEFVHAPPFSYETEARLRRGAPPALLAAVLPALEPDEYGRIAIIEEGRLWWSQVYLVVAVGVGVEEAMTRGLPLLVAGLLGVEPTLFVVAGTVVWAFLHGVGRGLTLLATTGWLLAVLWLQGHGALAVGLHLANNLGFWTLGVVRNRA